MQVLYASQHLSHSKTGGIQEAINTLTGGGVVIVDRRVTMQAPLTVSRPQVELRGAENPILDFSQYSGSSSALQIVASGIRVSNLTFSNTLQGGILIRGEIQDVEINHCQTQNTELSGIWADSGPSDVRILDCAISNYNVKNATGQGGIVVYGQAHQVHILRNSTQNGNGNGIRLCERSANAFTTDAWIEDNVVDTTRGHSAEGIGAGGHNIFISRNVVKRSWTTGILIYAGTPGFVQSDIHITDNRLYDCSQSTPYTGAHAAISIQVQGLSMQGILVVGNEAVDDQAKPTTERVADVQDGGQGGSLNDSYIAGNHQRGCISPTPFYVSPTVKLHNCTIS